MITSAPLSVPAARVGPLDAGAGTETTIRTKKPLIDRRILFAAVGVIVAAVLVLGILFLGRSHTPGSSAGASSEVSDALASLTSKPNVLVPSLLPADLVAGIATAVPAGSTVKTDEKSWRPRGSAAGIIVVTVTSRAGKATRFVASMQKQHGKWKVLSTIPIDGASK